MKIWLFRGVAAVAALMCTSVVAAEPPIGSRLGSRTTRELEKRERESALAAQELARCLVNKRNGIVRQYLGSLDTAESKRLDSRMNGEHQCFNMAQGNDLVEGRMIMYPHDIFRGMLAEWMIKADGPTFAALPALPRQLTYSRAWYAVSGRDSSVDEMATCVSETAPAETIALLKTIPYSDAEGGAFNALVPHLGACLRAGVKLTGNRQSLRAAVADALYQRVANPPPAVPAAAAAK